METSTPTYRTSNIYYAAYLRVAGVQFSHTEREGSRVWFYFDTPEDGLRDLKNQYYNRIAKVPALTYADEIKAMKDLTYTPE